jgi:transcriptional regulator with PAS, ATPase and Fis domain
LRERAEDIPLLGEHFLRYFAVSMNRNITGLSKLAQQQLLAHHWPGNVRELRNVIERAVILETEREIQPTSLPDFHIETRLRKGEKPLFPEIRSLDESMANFERDLIMTVLEQNHARLTKTAEQLRISRHALRYRMQRLNISLDDAIDEETTFSGGRDLAR